MDDAIHAFMALAGACFVAMAIGGSFAFGVATVCRWLKWAPMNTIINIERVAAISSHPHDAQGGGAA